ncbi:DNA repair protein RecN [Thioploca ingrica]|uniref:DNA repair protein RecN n=1 Tax=Thioploca ingrica TaxID=40754 RepID=A0A090AGH0_9GAMM|nr:DNA repair protein RecN [Thioploca ingrica]
MIEELIPILLNSQSLPLRITDKTVLQSLYIENFTIVKQLDLHLESGLTIISGETGAGKSILIDALSLVLGERADTSVIREGCEMARVKALFKLLPTTRIWLQQHQLSNQEDTCLVCREISHNGRSRGYINLQPVSIQMLRQLGEQLVDIHGQHVHQSLLKPETQRRLLDELAADKTVLEQVKQAYQQWKSLTIALDHLGGKDREAKIAFLRYQLSEFGAFELTPQALERLAEEHRRLANAHKLLENTQRALSLLDNDETGSILANLSQASHIVEEVQPHDSQLKTIITLLDNALIQTQEAVSELRHYWHHLDTDPIRLQEIQQQLILLQDLARKHRVNLPELPAHFENLMKQLHELENYEEHASRLVTQIEAALQNYRLVTEALHQQRHQTAQLLAEQITQQLQQLGMPGGQLLIAVIADEEAPPSAIGTNIIEFLVTTNPGQAPKLLHKVVSGGELSRISLAIQVITAQSSGVPILVFDEVDVGIGGRVAEIVGQLLNRLGQQRQVLCITHLPQVACQGHHHLRVSKTIDQQTTHTFISRLDPEQRIEEVARMLGGVEITSQTLAHAQEMLQRSHQSSHPLYN